MESNLKKSKISSVSVIRVISMLSIIIGHILSKIGYHLDIMNIGVYVFLFISGYLYGDKDIKNGKAWLVKRIKRVMFPFWIVAFCVLAYLVFSGKYSFAFRHFLITSFNLQGINRIFFDLNLQGWTTDNLWHCWFITVIFLCYIIMIFIKKSRIEGLCEHHPVLLLASSVIVQCLFALILHIQICYIIQFFVGYFICKYRSFNNKKKLLFFSLIFVIVFVIRITAKSAIDNTIMYSNIIAPLSFVALGSWLFIVGDFVLTRFNVLSDIIAESFVWKKLDQLSFSLYLTHFLFLYPPYAIMSEHIDLHFIFFIIATIISAILLNRVSLIINGVFSKKSPDMRGIA